ncbi:RNA-binding protein YlmH [Weissella uvarum]|uniref:YlmH family RNA-binding protein n=1 Tax=Weissella uvarum TaxID=1479233 RepID=UPI001960CCE3|nr:YlmH/Sll1252 family protein [Weissella uvarum]MBM7617785.1 RNA-binding protein YlmH [Weissella uvarum]MCM0595836.1 hypothetical protein [Weissella uvarum]
MADMRQHFRSNEQAFVQQAVDWVAQAVDEYRLVLTPFLNPRERYILQTLVNRAASLTLRTNGLIADAEMQRGLILPDYIDIETLDNSVYEMQLVEIVYPKKFLTLQHRTILGTLMHNGIERDRVGDIVTDDNERWQFVTTPVVADYVNQHIERIGGAKVHFKNVAVDQALVPNVEWETVDILATSTRLDNVVASTYQLSRSIAKQMVEHGDVKLNWAEQLHPDVTLEPGDLLSVRGHGRMQVMADNGLTRQDKHKLTVARLKK